MANTERRSRTKRGIFIALVLVLLVYIIGSTYARYTNTTTSTGKVTVAKWAVTINDDDMPTTATQDVTFVLDDNEYVSDGVIAPARSGHFDIVLDPTGSQVAIDYKIKCATTALTTATNGITDPASKISVTGAKYWIGEVTGDGTTATLTGDGVKIFEQLSDVEAGKAVTLRITVEWDNDSDNQNTHDTANGIAADEITIPVTVTAQQHIAADDQTNP